MEGIHSWTELGIQLSTPKCHQDIGLSSHLALGLETCQITTVRIRGLSNAADRQAHACPQSYYQATAREVRRLGSVVRSPGYAGFAEALAGAVTIRAFGAQERTAAANEAQVALLQRANLTGGGPAAVACPLCADGDLLHAWAACDLLQARADSIYRMHVLTASCARMC